MRRESDTAWPGLRDRVVRWLGSLRSYRNFWPLLRRALFPVDNREKRRLKRHKVRADQEKIEHPRADTSALQRPVYVA